MARRRKSPDKLLADALDVLQRMVATAPTEAYGKFETHSDRLTAVSKAVDVLSKVEERRWAFYLGRMKRDELVEFLQWREDRALKARGMMVAN